MGFLLDFSTNTLQIDINGTVVDMNPIPAEMLLIQNKEIVCAHLFPT